MRARDASNHPVLFPVRGPVRSARHDLTWGIDASRTGNRQKRDGMVTSLLTGGTSNAMLPDVFPVRDFPVSATTTWALYAQDEIAFGNDGAFRLVPLPPGSGVLDRFTAPGRSLALSLSVEF